MPKEFIKQLSGHSGCEISLYNDGEKFFVHKTAGRSDYNARLRKQIAKQISFKSQNSQRIFAPLVYTTGATDGVFWFDMQYLNCQTLARYMETITIKEISHMMDILTAELHITDSVVMPDTNAIFQKKIKSLRANIPHDQMYVNALDRLERFDFSSVPYSQCHGDLTLENILVDVNRNVYLIDFLDSFFDSWMIDVAKLLQDLELAWSYRHEQKSPNLELRLLVAREALLESLAELPNGKYIIIQIYYILLLNIMRIVPYTKDKLTADFLKNSIQKLNAILNTKEKTR